MFRCPHCAKVWKIPLTNDHSLLAGYNMNTWSIWKEPIHIMSWVENIADINDLAAKLPKLGLSLIDENAIPCPSCGEVHPFSEWFEAWENPGKFFDADQLCHCGGELWYDKIPGTSRYALVCDKCEWVKPNAIISGHEG